MLYGPSAKDERVFQQNLVRDQVLAIDSLLPGGEFAAKLCKANARHGAARTSTVGDEVQKAVAEVIEPRLNRLEAALRIAPSRHDQGQGPLLVVISCASQKGGRRLLPLGDSPRASRR